MLCLCSSITKAKQLLQKLEKAQSGTNTFKHQKEQNQAESNKVTRWEIALMLSPQTRADSMAPPGGGK